MINVSDPRRPTSHSMLYELSAFSTGLADARPSRSKLPSASS